MVPNPDRVETYCPTACDGCGAPGAEQGRVAAGNPVSHQVSEVKVRGGGV